MLALKSLLDIIASPFTVFDSIQQRMLSGWLPFCLLIVSIASLYGWYFFTVDLYSFLEASMALSGQEVVPDDLEVILKQEQIIRVASVGSVVISTAVINLVLAFYFYLAAMLVAEEKLTFGVLFALVCWASVPGLVSIFSSVITYTLSTGFIYIAFLDQTSVASILGLALTTPHFDLYSSITVGGIWSYVLFGVGFYRVIRCSMVTACVVAVVPLLLQMGMVYFI